MPFYQTFVLRTNAVLKALVNSALILVIFPDGLKLAKVISLFKRGDKLEPTHIFINLFKKFFEKVIFNRLSNFFNKHSVLVPNQYGFRAGCSTSHTILDIVTYIYDNIENNHCTGMVTEWLHLMLLKLLIQYVTKDF